MHMELYCYIKKNRLTIEKFAQLVGCTRLYMGRIISGKTQPSAVLACLIEKETKGEIKAEQLRKQS